MIELTAHRGFSGREPEMTRAAYIEALGWSAVTRTPLGLECDVHFSADDHLVCLHDLTVDRTSNGRGRAYDKTLLELRRLNFGGRRTRQLPRSMREIVTLVELLDLVRRGRSGALVTAVIETKHPNPRGLDVEERVAELLRERGWDDSYAPVRLITFDVAGLRRLGELLPSLRRTFLIEKEFGEWTDGALPDGVTTVGVDLKLIRADPDYVRRARERGNEVHVWTVNRPEDVAFCLELGVTGFTTDVPDVVAACLPQ